MNICMYILKSSPLSYRRFANIVSQTVACLFILFTGAFTEKKYLILMKSSVSIFPFMDHAFYVEFKGSLHSPAYRTLFSCF